VRAAAVLKGVDPNANFECRSQSSRQRNLLAVRLPLIPERAWCYSPHCAPDWSMREVAAVSKRLYY